MKQVKDPLKWSPDKKIAWGASLLLAVLSVWLVMFLDAIDAVHLGKGQLWAGPGLGCVLAAVVNWLRPRYDQAGHFWKPIYRFLLEQMSPPE